MAGAVWPAWPRGASGRAMRWPTRRWGAIWRPSSPARRWIGCCRAGGLARVPVLAGLEAEPDKAGFAPHLLDLTASLEATTRETELRTHNVIGMLPGRHPGSS